VDALIRRLSDIALDYLLLITLLAGLVVLLLLISRLRTGRAYRRMREERDALKQQLATLQTAYDSEIRWRTASEKHDAPKATT
jgi:hypothetical protein